MANEPSFQRLLFGMRRMSESSLRNLEVRGLILDELSRRMDLTFLALDRQRQVAALSPAAESLLSMRDGLKLMRSGLEAERFIENQLLQRILRSILDHADTSVVPTADPRERALVISRRKSHWPLRVEVARLTSNGPETTKQPIALLLISSAAMQRAPRAEVMRELFDLLPSEARFTDLLLQGFDVQAAAEQMRITLNSARFLLKGIFRKTATNTQSDLLRLVISLPGRPIMEESAYQKALRPRD